MEFCSIKNIPRIVIGFFAVILSLFLAFQQENLTFVFFGAALLAIICLFDTLTSKIPNVLNLALLLAGALYNFLELGLRGIGFTLLGFLIGFLFLLVPYLLGGIGGGDVKALAALGALLGPVTILHVFLYIALFGGLFSILHYLFSRNFLEKAAGAGRALMAFAGTRDVEILRPATTEKLRFPYASAIAFGFFSYVQWGSIFTLLKSL